MTPREAAVEGASATDRPAVTTPDQCVPPHLQLILNHDYRPHEQYTVIGRRFVYWRCIWCHVISCGPYAEHDPCMRPRGHTGPHVSRLGDVWTQGANRTR